MNPKPERIDAAYALVGGGIAVIEEELVYLDGQTPPSDSAIDEKFTSLMSEWDAQAYARNRKTDYPDWGTQLNKIYDDGITKWKSEMVDPVKTKWPKDNSGPVE